MSERMSVKEAAERLDVTTAAIRLWIREGEFPNAYKKRPSAMTSPYVIPLSDIMAFEARRHEKSKKP